MKPYTNKTDKVDNRKCLYSEIEANNKCRKKAARFVAKKEINEEEFQKAVEESNERIKKVQDATKIDPLDLLRKFD